MAGGIAYYFGDGRMTGDVPKQAAARDLFYRQGKQPFSVKIGDTWVSYQRLEPFNQVFMQIAAVVSAIENDDPEATIQEKAGEAAMTFAKGFISQTYMEGLARFWDAIQDPETYGESYISRLGAALTPFSSLSRTIAQALDPVYRRPEGYVENVEAILPGLSEQVPARLDVFGNEAIRQTPFWSPINITREEANIVDANLAHLNINIGQVGDTINGIKLTRDEHLEYQRFSGQHTYNALLFMMQMPAFQSAPDEAQKASIKKVLTKSRDFSRAQFTIYLANKTNLEGGLNRGVSTSISQMQPLR
jgi:hypothetical protein